MPTVAGCALLALPEVPPFLAVLAAALLAVLAVLAVLEVPPLLAVLAQVPHPLRCH